MTEEIASQGRIAGGQQCPGCGEIAGVADSYCSWCGASLRESLDERVSKSRLDAAEKAIDRWRRWATLWAAIAVFVTLYSMARCGGWFA